MAIETFMTYRTSGGDAVGDLNSRFSGLIRKGFVTAWLDAANSAAETMSPTLQSVAGSLEIDVLPGGGLGWIALSADGMLLRESTDTYRVAVVDGAVNYIVLRAKYNVGVGASLIGMTSMSQSSYDTSPIQTQYIVVGTVDLSAGGFTDTVGATLAYAARDRLNGLYDASWLPSVSTFANLPTIITNPFLKTGDMIITRDTLMIYGWNGTAFSAAGGAANLVSATGITNQSINEMIRVTLGTGIMGGPNTSLDYGAEPRLELHNHSSTADTLGLGEIRAAINGHLVKTAHIDLTLDAKPGVGERYDLAYLEVMRVTLADPSTHNEVDYSGASVTPSAISTKLEDLTASSGEAAGTNFSVSSIEVTPAGAYVAVTYSVRFVSNIGLTGIADIYDMAAIGAPTNSDSVAWTCAPSSQYDNRVWLAAHTGSADGYSWGIPLVVIRRTVDEDAGLSDAIQIFRNDARYVYPINPETASVMGKDVPEVMGYARASAANPTFHSGLAQIPTLVKSAALSIRFTAATDVIIAGYRATIPLSDSVFTFDTAPATGARRDLAYITAKIVMYPDNGTTSRVVVPLGLYGKVPYSVTYPKALYLQLDMVVADVGAIEEVEAAFTALGYSHTSGDAGLWELADTTFDPRNNVGQTTYAIPVMLVHRLSSASYTLGTAPNGGAVGSRPDGYQHNNIPLVPRFVTPVWHHTGVTRDDLDVYLSRSLDAAFRGNLRTKIVRHPQHTNIAGAQHLYADAISAGVTAGAYNLPAAPDGVRTCWSEARESRPFGATFDPTVNYTDGNIIWTASGGGSGHLQVITPPGSSLLVTSSGDVVHFLHADSTTVGGGTGPTPFTHDHNATVASGPTTLDSIIVNSTDVAGNPVDIEMDITGSSTDLIHAYFWIQHIRDPTDIIHQDNGGLQAAPQNIVSAFWGASFANNLATSPLVTEIEAVGTGLTLTLSAADLATATGRTGTHTYNNVLGISVQDDLRSSFTYLATITDTADTLTITFSTTMLGKTVRVLVGYTSTTWSRWIEIAGGGRSVVGNFNWGDVEWTGITNSDSYVFLGGAATTLANTFAMRFGALMYRDTATSDPWDVIPSDQYTATIREGTATIVIEALGAGYQSALKDYRVSVVLLTPPSTTDQMLIYYEGTPYQGVSPSVSIGNRPDAIRDLLQGEMLHPGKSFITTAGYGSYYMPPLNTATAVIARSSLDQDFRLGNNNRAAGLVGAGTGSWRMRQISAVNATTDWEQIGFLTGLGAGQFDACIDNLPWPDLNGTTLFAAGSASQWEPSTINGWDLDYDPIPVGLAVSGEYNKVPGGFLYVGDPPLTAEQFGAISPSAGMVVEYGSAYTAGQITTMETYSFVDGLRGVAVTHAASRDGEAYNRYVADGVAFLAFGSLEGLHYSEAEEGVVTFLIPAETPTYLQTGTEYLIGGPNTAYYGGHATLIRALGGTWVDVVTMQIAGSPKQLSGISPSSPYGAQLGGTFDAFWPINRPLPANRRS